MSDSVVQGLTRGFIDGVDVYLEHLSNIEGKVVLFSFLKKFSGGFDFTGSVPFFFMSVGLILAPCLNMMGDNSLVHIFGWFFFYCIRSVVFKCATPFDFGVDSTSDEMSPPYFVLVLDELMVFVLKVIDFYFFVFKEAGETCVDEFTSGGV